MTALADPHNYLPESDVVLVPHSSAHEPLGAEYVDASPLPGLPPDFDTTTVRLLAAIKPGSALDRFNETWPDRAVMVGSVVLSTVTTTTAALSATSRPYLAETSTEMTIGRWCWNVRLEPRRKCDVGCSPHGHPGFVLADQGPFKRVTDIVRDSAVHRWNRMNRTRSIRPMDTIVAVNGVFTWADTDLGCFSGSSGSQLTLLVVRVPSVEGRPDQCRCKKCRNEVCSTTPHDMLLKKSLDRLERSLAGSFKIARCSKERALEQAVSEATTSGSRSGSERREGGLGSGWSDEGAEEFVGEDDFLSGYRV